jgi:histone deacetylase 11
LLRPMRYAAYGTVVAADAAVEPSIAVNLGGGFHHAFASRGEGFCIYADVAMAIQLMRRRGAIGPQDPIWVIDLDAHRGNGIEDIFGHDENVHFFDIYNFQIYPGPPSEPEKEEPPFLIPVKSRCSEEFYLTTLHRELDQFLESAPSPKLAFYNAGTDVVDGDPLGRLKVSEEGVFERDRYVIDSLAKRGIPTVIVTSGGYTDRSYKMIARMASYVVREYAGLATSTQEGLVSSGD